MPRVLGESKTLNLKRDTRHKITSTMRLVLLEESDLDTILAPLPLGTRRQPSTLNPQPSTLNPQPSTLNPQPSTLNTQLSTHNPQPSTLNPRPSTLNPEGTHPLGTRRLVKHAWLKEPPKAAADKAAVHKKDPSQAISVRERLEKPTAEKVPYLSLAFPG